LFEYKSVDQNGFDYYIENGNYEVSYTIQPVFADVNVYDNHTGTFLGKVNKGTTGTFKVHAVGGKALLRVQSADTAIASNVTVSASSSQISLEDIPATVSFTKYSSSVVTGLATGVDAGKDELTIGGTLYSYTGANYQYGGSSITVAKFEEYIASNTATISVTKDDAGKLTFNVISIGATADAIVDAVNGAANAGQVKSALASYSGFSALPVSIQNRIASTLPTGVLYTTTTLDNAYALAFKNAVTAEIGAVDAAAVLAKAVGAGQTEYTALVNAVKNIPGSATVATNLNAVTNAVTQKAIATAVDALTAPTVGTAAENATAYLASVQNAINVATAAESVQPTVDAIAAFNAGTVIDGPTLLAALKATNVSNTAKTNAAVLGLDLTKVTPANEAAFATKLFALKGTGFTDLNIGTRFDTAVTFVTDATAPTVDSAVYDTTAGTLTITFSENVVGSTPVVEADFNFGVTASTTAQTATLTGNKLVITIDAATVAAGFGKGVSITALTLNDAGSTVVTLTDDSNASNPYTFVTFSVAN